MADKKISALTAATTPLAGTEVLPIVQSSTTVKVSVADVTKGRTIQTTGINDNNNNEVITITTTASAVNEITIANAATGANPVISATGSDTNIGITLTPKGTGNAVLTTGNLVVANGNGINFSATAHAAGMTSELLADYEEGTWTPEYDAFAGTFSTLTYTTQQGTYTRVGRTVICQFYIIVNAVTVGTAATLLLLKGFPFAINVGANAGAQSNGYINFYIGWTTNAPTLINYAGFTDKLGLLYSGATDISNTPPANVTAACQLRGTVFYQV